MASSRYCVILLALVPSILGQCSIETAKPYFGRSVYEFSIDLAKRIAQENENHFVASPLSVWALLATLSLGASDVTLKEMQEVLRLHQQKCFNNKMFVILNNTVRGDDVITLERSSSVFIEDQFPVKQSFIKKVRHNALAEVEIIKFDDFYEVARTINNYVSEKTYGHVDEIVLPDDLAGVHLILVDALYFKGNWLYPFVESDTRPSAFYASDGIAQIGYVDMMFVTAEFKWAKFDSINTEVIQLPYQSEKHAMLIFLPDKSTNVPDLLDKLKSVSLSSILNTVNQHTEQCQVKLPRFKVSSHLNNLKELLSDMGLRDVFSSTAQLTEISDFALYVSDVVQKASLEVNEEGSEASAASGGFVSSRSFSPEFYVDRPFLYMIVDLETKFPLFTGAYGKPT